jgi:hypothetical protein
METNPQPTLPHSLQRVQQVLLVQAEVLTVVAVVVLLQLEVQAMHLRLLGLMAAMLGQLEPMVLTALQA